MRVSDWAAGLLARAELPHVTFNFDGKVGLTRIAAEARPFLVAAAYLETPRQTLIITPTYERALHWQARLGLCGVPADQILLLPSGTSALFELITRVGGDLDRITVPAVFGRRRTRYRHRNPACGIGADTSSRAVA